MATRLIFIAHGQLPQERQNGLALARLVDETDGFRAFFAENVQSTDALSRHILGNLERCDGFLAVMHHRGTVTYPGGRPRIRASVWIQQELAIVSFINHQREDARHIKIRVFAQQGIEREGLADVLIVNATEFERDEELPDRVREWLAGPDFAPDPTATTRQTLFRRSIDGLTLEHWRYLEVLTALSRGNSSEIVYEDNIRRMLEQMGLVDPDWPRIGRELAGRGFLIKRLRDVLTGLEPNNIAPAFADLLVEEFRRRGSFMPGAA